MRRTIWLSYDLGVGGDFEGLYSWLDNHGAKECGSSIAFIPGYEFRGDLPDYLKRDIKEAVNLGKRSRIYVIYQADGLMRGKYLIGRRKGSPWTGFGDQTDPEFDSEFDVD